MKDRMNRAIEEMRNEEDNYFEAGTRGRKKSLVTVAVVALSFVMAALGVTGALGVTSAVVGACNVAELDPGHDWQEGHQHDYAWMTMKEATEDADGESAYACVGCGQVLYRIPISGAGIFNTKTAEKIINAEKNGTVQISTNKWNAFSYVVRDALQARPDVTLELTYLDGAYKGNQMKVVIPAGTDVSKLFDENGYAGFTFLGKTLGATQIKK